LNLIENINNASAQRVGSRRRVAILRGASLYASHGRVSVGVYACVYIGLRFHSYILLTNKQITFGATKSAPAPGEID